MSEIIYIRGDATVPSVKGVKVIAHVWRRGQMSEDFGLVTAALPASGGQARAPKGRGELRDQPHTSRRQRPSVWPTAREPRSNQWSATSRIGCGLAGGKWSRVEPLVTERLVKRGIMVTVYDQGETGS